MLGCFVVTIALVIVTIPRKLPVTVALSLTLGVQEVLGSGGLIHGLRTYRAVNTIAMVYASGANALARGGVRIDTLRLGRNSRTLLSATVTLGSATRLGSNGPVKGPARSTLLL